MTTPDFSPLEIADPKPWYRSRGVLGSLMVVVAQLGALAGLSLDPGLLTELALQGVTLAGGVIALWGRVRAEQPVRF